jgi:hypothetical protein
VRLEVLSKEIVVFMNPTVCVDRKALSSVIFSDSNEYKLTWLRQNYGIVSIKYPDGFEDVVLSNFFWNGRFIDDNYVHIIVQNSKGSVIIDESKKKLAKRCGLFSVGSNVIYKVYYKNHKFIVESYRLIYEYNRNYKENRLSKYVYFLRKDIFGIHDEEEFEELGFDSNLLNIIKPKEEYICKVLSRPTREVMSA